MAIKLKTTIAIIILIALAMLVLNSNPRTSNLNWKSDYKKAMEQNNISSTLLQESNEYDFNKLKETINYLDQISSNEEDYLVNVIKYVNDNILYSIQSLPECYDYSAYDTAVVGKGDCVTMSKLAIALLRGNGIVADMEGGCVKKQITCYPMFAMYIKERKLMPMVRGDYKKRGNLHSWVKVWLPKTGWLYADPTSGEITRSDCKDYLPGGDANIDLCLVRKDFWDTCNIY